MIHVSVTDVYCTVVEEALVVEGAHDALAEAPGHHLDGEKIILAEFDVSLLLSFTGRPKQTDCCYCAGAQVHFHFENSRLFEHHVAPCVCQQSPMDVS